MSRVLLLGQYPLDRLDRAPKVRIHHMAEALGRLVDLDVITGTRGERAPRLRRYLRVGALRTLDGVYVESATSTMTTQDWRFLKAVRRAGVPLAIFIRDWYQRFPDLYPPSSWREWAMARLYTLTVSQYARLGTTLFFPTEGLAQLVPHADRRTLPPAGPILSEPSLPRTAGRVVYVGANGPHDGVATAVNAMGRVAAHVPGAHLLLVMRRTEWPSEVPPWCRVVDTSGPDLEPCLWSSMVGLIPRRDTAYNRLALPLKLFDYLAHGLPVVTTEGSEAGRFVVETGTGLAVPDDAAAYAEAIRWLFEHPEQVGAMGRRARERVARCDNWDLRARTVLELEVFNRP